MMPYVVTWLNDQKILGEKEFDNLFKAKAHVTRATGAYRKRGATAARVWDDRATYFQIEWPADGSAERDGLLH